MFGTYHRIVFPWHGLFALLILPRLVMASDSTRERPNIVIMMADDMGFSDIGCYGGEIETPHLDRLAGHGVRFTQFYNTSRCCPTRAALLTGLYPHQAGIGHMMDDRQLPGYRGDLQPNSATIAQVLGLAGYATYMSGKWHVTKKIGPRLAAGDQANWPCQRGFDEFFGTIHGAGSFFDPNSLARNNQLIAPDSDEFYYTDAIANQAVRFISEHDARRPFFLYVAFTAPHWPMHAKPADIQKYHGRYREGWDKLRAERRQRMIDIGLIDARWKLTDRDRRAQAWDDVPMSAWSQRRMEVYAAMVDCLDQGVGRIVAQLQASDYFDNTLILFLADNGGCAEESGTSQPALEIDLRPRQANDGPMQPGELQTQMIPRKTRDGWRVRQGRGVMPGPADTYVAYGLEWANASNTPFRRYKHWVHEGGISSPLIVHWPRGVPSEQHNRWVRDPAHLIDLMATCVDVGQAHYPESLDGHALTPLPGISVRPSFTGQPLERIQPLFWEHEGNRAMREGRWKLVAQGPRGPWELYDMQEDRTETNNLADEQSERVQDMARRWEAWAVAARVKPWPWND